MSDLLTVGLAIATGYRSKKDREDLLNKQEKESRAALALDDRKTANQIKVDKAKIDAETLAKQRLANSTRHLVTDKNGMPSVYTQYPGQQLNIPKDSKVTGIAMGGATTFQSLPGQDQPSQPLFRDTKGNVGTAQQLNNQYRNLASQLGEELTGKGNRIEIGVLKTDGTKHIYNQNDMQEINGVTYQTRIELPGIGMVLNNPEGQAKAIDYARTTGNTPTVVTTAVSRNGMILGTPTKTKFDVGAAPTTEGTFTRLIGVPGADGFMSPTELNNFLEDNPKVELDKVVHSVYTGQVDPTGKLVPNTLKLQSRNHPEDAEITTQPIALNLGNGYVPFDNIQEAKVAAAAAGIAWEDTDHIVYDKVTKGGEQISFTVSSTQNPKEKKKAVGTVELSNGKTVQVFADSKAELINKFGDGVIFQGMFVVNNDGSIGKGTSQTSVDVELTLADGSTVRRSDATPEQIQSAVSQTPITIDNFTNEITERKTTTDAPIAAFHAKHIDPSLRLSSGQNMSVFSNITNPLDAMVALSVKLTDSNINEINSNDLLRKQYVTSISQILGAKFRQVINEQKIAALSGGSRPQRIQKLFPYIKNSMPSFLQINGMEDELKRMSGIEVITALNNAANAAQALAGDGDFTLAGSVHAETGEEFDNPTQEAENDEVVFAYNVPKTFVSFTTNALLPAVKRGTSSPNAALEAMFKKDRGLDGEPLTGPDGVVMVSKDQPLVAAMQKLSTKKRPNGTTYFDMFVDSINGNIDGIQADDYRYFGNTLIGAVNQKGGGIQRFVEAIRPLVRDSITEDGDVTPAFFLQPMDPQGNINPAMQELARQNGFMGDGSNPSAKAFQAKLGKVESADRVISYSNQLLDGYFLRDQSGKITGYNSSTAVGNLELNVQGLLYLKDAGLNALNGLVGKDKAEQIGDLFVGNLNSYKKELLKNHGLKEEEGIKGTGQSEMEAELRLIAKSVADAGNDQANRALAVRQLYIVNLAYELSAMMQGGTGGRTISDQDVAIIFRALRQQLTATPRSQAQVIIEVREIAREMRAEMMYATSTDPATQVAYSFAKAVSAVSDRGFHREITPQSIANRINGVSPAEAQRRNEKPAMDPTAYASEVLKQVNKNLTATGKDEISFEDGEEVTLDAIREKAFGAGDSAQQMFETIQKTTNRSLNKGSGV
tara:strand:- start:215 stop:3718 length:3504 start_codon:yes stop_codon:yes gene_type:complete